MRNFNIQHHTYEADSFIVEISIIVLCLQSQVVSRVSTLQVSELPDLNCLDFFNLFLTRFPKRQRFRKFALMKEVK